MSPIQFVSLGPGEAELITLKGLKALQNADCIFCPETPVRDGHSLSRAAGIPVEQIAGIPAFIAAGARGGLHIASQEERLTVIPGITTAEEIERLIQSQNTVVIMKLSQCTDEVHRCIRLHPEYDYRYFENVGTPQEKYISDGQQLETLRFPYFSLLIIRHNGF
jgi:precorrin-2/cobalt-factor-2 C20-methyltransferase